MVELNHAVIQLHRTPLPLPISHLGMWTAFQVEDPHEEAID